MRAFGRARGRVRACSRAVVALTAAALVAGLAAAGPAAAAQPPPHSSVLLAQTSEGLPRIVGEARVGEVLSVDLSDISGTVATMAVKWWRTVGVSSTEQVAEASTYTLTDADLGEQLSVLVVLTDGRILASSFTAAVIAADATTNTAATGEPAISGTLRVHEVLTASPGTIDDDDGLTSVTYSYQWISDDADITGAASSTYRLTGDDLGKAIKVEASFTDEGGTLETVTSAATAAVGGPIGVTVATDPATTPPALAVDEDGPASTYTLVLTDEPSAAVTIDISATAGGEVTTNPARVTFEAANWDTARTITVSAGPDTDTFSALVTLSHTATRPDIPSYAITIDDVAVTVTDTGSFTPNNPATVAPAPSTSGGTTGGPVGGGGGGGGGGAPPPEPEPEPQLRDYFVDDDGNVHEADINKIAAAAITVGCGPSGDGSARDRYCPDQPVTRAEMASLLARALDLPGTGTDYFVDDDGSVHEADINKIAAAAITVGCNPPDDRPAGNHYCPDQPVTRAQMASLLARALDLPGTGTDYFVDDDGSVHEADINKIAAAAITVGCNPPDDRPAGDRYYCPDQPVTRAQMASLLARALDL